MNPLVVLGLVVGGLYLFSQSSKASAATAAPGAARLADGGQYYQAYASQVAGYTQAFADNAITQQQWAGYMQSLLSQILTAQANGQLTANDVATLKAAMGY